MMIETRIITLALAKMICKRMRMSSEASEEESHSASGGVGVDEEVSDSSNNNTMREEDRLRLKAPTQPFPPLLYINIPYSQVFFQFLPHVIS